MSAKVREVVIDLCGGALSQSAVERVISDANAPGDEGLVTITIKNITRHGIGGIVPRLIVDHGDLIYRIVAEMDRRETELRDRDASDYDGREREARADAYRT